jgi:hypothetical protein
MLQGLRGLIETMNQHGRTISSVNDSAHQTDVMMGTNSTVSSSDITMADRT